MLAFAGNSVICRLALGSAAIDASSFTVVRLAAGALTLLAIAAVRGRAGGSMLAGRWRSALSLFAYALFFSFAYVHLDTASGALILFGTVQATLIAAALLGGERPRALEWLGWATALAGFVWMLAPGAGAPSLAGALMMMAAGVSWGFYTLDGRGEARPLAATAGNFLRALAPTALLAVLGFGQAEASSTGLLLAVLSGALTTGVGYVLWYAALPHLSSLQAALVQLSVPGIAAAGGVLFVSEILSLRLALSGALVLGGICLAVAGRHGR